MNTICRALCLAAGLTAAAGAMPAFAGDTGVPDDDANAVNASLVFSNCLSSRHDFISNDNTGLTANNVVYGAVPGMTKVINQAQPGCVVVVASSYAFATAGELQFVRVVLNPGPNQRLCSPIEWQWSGDDDEDANGRWARTHGAVCAFNNVAAGNHIVQLQRRSQGGGNVTLHRPSMDIEHR